MALDAALEALLTELAKTDPEGAKQQRALLEKHEPLRAGYLRQADYDRQMNATKAEQTKATESTREANEWLTRNKGKHDTALASLKDIEAKYATLETEKQKLERDLATKAAAAAAASDGNVDPENIAEAVKTRLGDLIPTPEKLSALIAEETTKQVTAENEKLRNAFFKDTFPAAASWMSNMLDCQLNYRDEFSKPLDKIAFTKFLTDNKITDPEKGYEQFIAPLRTESEVQRRVKEEVDKQLKERGAEVPGSSGAPATGGHLQVRLAERSKDDPLFGSEVALGDNQSAMAAAAEMRAGK